MSSQNVASLVQARRKGAHPKHVRHWAETRPPKLVEHNPADDEKKVSVEHTGTQGGWRGRKFRKVQQGGGWAGAKALGLSGWATGEGFFGRLKKGAVGFATGLFSKDSKAKAAALGNAAGYAAAAPYIGHKGAEIAGVAAGVASHQAKGWLEDKISKAARAPPDQFSRPDLQAADLKSRIGEYTGKKRGAPKHTRKGRPEAYRHGAIMSAATGSMVPMATALAQHPGLQGVTNKQAQGDERPARKPKALHPTVQTRRTEYANKEQLHSALDRIGNTQRRKMFGFGKERPNKRACIQWATSETPSDAC